MPTAAILLLATPIFGLSLTPPSATLPLLDVGVSAAAEVGSSEEEAEASEASPDSDSDGDAPGPTKDAAEDDYREQTKTRNSIIKLHRPFGIATWAAMTVTVALGIIQYYNLYGFFADLKDTPCVQGDAIFGQEQCFGTPWPHAIAAGVTTALYGTTFALSIAMPDPDDLSSGPGEFASTLRLHKFLRWIHFGGMVAQVLLGIVIANDLFGLDRANDYSTLQGLATVHQGIGIVTLGALTWAGALMTF